MKCSFKSNHHLLLPLESTPRICPRRALRQSRVMDEAHRSAHLSFGTLFHRHGLATPPVREASVPGGLAALGLVVARLLLGSGFSRCMGDGGKPRSQKKGQPTAGDAPRWHPESICRALTPPVSEPGFPGISGVFLERPSA